MKAQPDGYELRARDSLLGEGPGRRAVRGTNERTGSLFSYVDIEARVRKDHPLRTIRSIVDASLVALETDFSALYSRAGRPSVAPERLVRAMLLQAFYSVRAERQLMERLEFDLLFRWFVGFGIDEAVRITRPSRRTVTGCWRATSPRSSSQPCWPSRA